MSHWQPTTLTNMVSSPPPSSSATSPSFFNLNGATASLALNEMSQYQHNLTQIQQNMSQLQQDMSQARIAVEGDTSLQTVYLERLQELVPWVPKDEELPKLQLVQAVIDYIKLLQEQLATTASSGITISDPTTSVYQDYTNYYDDINMSNVDECSGAATSCYDSSPCSLSPSSASPQTPPSVHSHLFHHLQEKQMVNELHNLQMVQRTSGEEMGSQQMVDGFINQHQIINDLRQKRLNESTSGLQHMANPVGGGDVVGVCGGSASDSTALTQLASTDTNATYPQQPVMYTQQQNIEYESQIQSIFPFPAPPSPQTIKAARKKKFQLKRQQELQQQQQLQQQLLRQHQQEQDSHYQSHQRMFSAIES